MTNKQDFNILVGANLKRARENAGLTQERFSDLLGIGPKSLSAIERGTVGISLFALRRACEILAISADDLVFSPTEKNDISETAAKLERLSPEQFEITNDLFNKLLEAFCLSKSAHPDTHANQSC